jgi:hypothetical protein
MYSKEKFKNSIIENYKRNPARLNFIDNLECVNHSAGGIVVNTS